MDDGWEGVDAALARFGLPARPEDRDAIIAALDEQMALEADERGDQFLIRLLCAQLFSLGRVEDSLRVWRAQACHFDTPPRGGGEVVGGGGAGGTRGGLCPAGGGDGRAGAGLPGQGEGGG